MSRRRKIVLTGSSSGIGAAIRQRLLQDGHEVIGVARRTPEEAAGRYKHVQLDLSDLDSIRPRLNEEVAKLAGIDALISNAGGPAFGYLEQVSEDSIRRAIDLNLTSHILVTRALLPLLKQQATSDVVFMGSESALRAGKRGSLYSAAKFGLRGFAQALRRECASAGTRVAIINPGMVRTQFFDALDFQPGESPDNALRPEDVAEVVALLLAAPAGTVFEEINLGPLKTVIRNPPQAQG